MLPCYPEESCSERIVADAVLLHEEDEDKEEQHTQEEHSITQSDKHNMGGNTRMGSRMLPPRPAPLPVPCACLVLVFVFVLLLLSLLALVHVLVLMFVCVVRCVLVV